MNDEQKYQLGAWGQAAGATWAVEQYKDTAVVRESLGQYDPPPDLFVIPHDSTQTPFGVEVKTRGEGRKGWTANVEAYRRCVQWQAERFPLKFLFVDPVRGPVQWCWLDDLEQPGVKQHHIGVQGSGDYYLVQGDDVVLHSISSQTPEGSEDAFSPQVPKDARVAKGTYLVPGGAITDLEHLRAKKSRLPLHVEYEHQAEGVFRANLWYGPVCGANSGDIYSKFMKYVMNDHPGVQRLRHKPNEWSKPVCDRARWETDEAHRNALKAMHLPTLYEGATA